MPYGQSLVIPRLQNCCVLRSPQALIVSPMPGYLAVAECTDGSVDRVGGTARGQYGYGRLLYGQGGTVRVDKAQGPVWEATRNGGHHIELGVGSE